MGQAECPGWGECQRQRADMVLAQKSGSQGHCVVTGQQHLTLGLCFPPSHRLLKGTVRLIAFP